MTEPPATSGSNPTTAATTSAIDPSNIKVVSIQKGEILAAADVVARAFCDSPVYVLVLQHLDRTARVEALRWLFERNLLLLWDRCPLAMKCIRYHDDPEDESGQIVGTFILTPREHEKIDKWTMIRYGGALQLPYRLGWGGLVRLISVMDQYEAAWKEIWDNYRSRDADEWTMLERMTILPEFQGKGVGTAALRTVLLAKDDIRGGGGNNGQNRISTTVRLTTQEERNMRFYRRLGFNVIAERDFGDEGNTHHAWFMVLPKA